MIHRLPPTRKREKAFIENDRHNNKQDNAVSETNVIGDPVAGVDGKQRACIWISICEFKTGRAAKLCSSATLWKAEFRSTSFVFAAADGNGLAH